jgi:hypothetical protein
LVAVEKRFFPRTVIPADSSSFFGSQDISDPVSTITSIGGVRRFLSTGLIAVRFTMNLLI